MSAASVAAISSWPVSVQIATRRTGSRSISVPTKSPSTVIGSICASASAPTARGECVISRTSHAAAICWIQLPVNETAWPPK